MFGIVYVLVFAYIGWIWFMILRVLYWCYLFLVLLLLLGCGLFPYCFGLQCCCVWLGLVLFELLFCFVVVWVWFV